MQRMTVAFFLIPALLAGSAALRAQSSSLPPGTSAPPDAPTSRTPAQKASELSSTDPLQSAENKLAAGDFSGAQSTLQAFVSAHPADPRALYDLGYAEDALNNPSGAQAAYRKAIAADPGQFESHAALGLLLLAGGKPAEAAEAKTQLQAASALQPNPPNPAAQAQANRALARLLEAGTGSATPDPQAAGKALVAAIGQTSETPSDALLAAEIAARQGNTDAAADAYGRALATTPAGSPQAAEASAGLAHLLIAAKRYQEAEAVVGKALASSPQNPALLSELAAVQSAEAKPSDAVATLEALHAVKPQSTEVTLQLADLYRQTGALEKAQPLYTELLAAHPHDPALLAEEGDLLIRKGEFPASIAPLEEATRLDPSNGNAWSSLAFAASQTHQPQLVLDALAMRSKVLTETPATYFLAATSCDTLHESKRARELYRQFLSVAGNSFPDEVWQARHRLVALAK